MCQKLVALTGSVWHTVNLLNSSKNKIQPKQLMFCQKTKFRLKNPLSKNFFWGGLSQATVPDSNQSVLLPLLWPTRVDGLNFSYIFEKTQFFRRKKNPCNCLKERTFCLKILILKILILFSSTFERIDDLVCSKHFCDYHEVNFF